MRTRDGNPAADPTGQPNRIANAAIATVAAAASSGAGSRGRGNAPASRRAVITTADAPSNPNSMVDVQSAMLADSPSLAAQIP